jgi:superfamily I DNA/RNA helicase
MLKRGLDYDDATLSSTIMEKYDTINALLVLSEKCKSKTELIWHIKEVFEENTNGVCLSTVHKSKGLEADNVYILCHSTMPSKLATLEWQKLQEKNLLYVAYTRAKKKLGFVSEKEVKPTGALQDPMEIINELAFVERKVCAILGKTPMERLENADLARFKLQNRTKIKDLHEEDNVIEVKETQAKNNEDLLNDLEALIK